VLFVLFQNKSAVKELNGYKQNLRAVVAHILMLKMALQCAVCADWCHGRASLLFVLPVAIV
jgi:hypothetical protein